MKTKERSSVKSGGYTVKFASLYRPQNTVGLKETKNGNKVAMFFLEAESGDKISYLMPWNLDEQKTRSVLGSLGVRADKLKSLSTVEEQLIAFEKTAKQKALAVSVYVREDGGLGSGLRPIEGNFILKFLRIASRADEGKGAACWEYIPSQTRKTKKGGTFETDPENVFKVDFVVAAGEQTGAIFTSNYRYSIVKDEKDDWVVDAESSRGSQFKQLMALHKVDTDSLDPDSDFEDPNNGLPELEKLMLKRGGPLQADVVKSWITKLSKVPDGVSLEALVTDTVRVEDENGSEYAASTELVTRLFAALDRRVKKFEGKSAWNENGELSDVGEEWMKKNKLPSNFTELTDKQVETYIAKLKEKFPVK